MSAFRSGPAAVLLPSGCPEIVYGRTVEGHRAAQVGNDAFVMLPRPGGGHYLAHGWRIGRPVAEWTCGDFYGHLGELADETAFRAKVGEHAVHRRQEAALGRREMFPGDVETPWGPSQCAIVYADGVVRHLTASHGGFRLSPDRNAQVHPLLRSHDGYYEEDCHWSAVAQAFPVLFTDFERACAERTLRDWHPDAFEAIHGRVLEPGESREKDRVRFKQKHASDWVAISALTLQYDPGFVEVIATPGGQRGEGVRKRWFLVERDAYRSGPFGYVVDEGRDRACDGPSAFAGWTGEAGS